MALGLAGPNSRGSPVWFESKVRLDCTLGAVGETGPGNSWWLGWTGSMSGGRIETSPDSTIMETSSRASRPNSWPELASMMDHPDWFEKSCRLGQKPG